MKNQFFIFLLFVVCSSCLDKKKQEDYPVLGDETVTFVVENVPKGHDFNDDIFISGDFEAWSGGREPFKLKKENQKYIITIPKYQNYINFKFTKGDWISVECKSNGNPIENRVYAFSKLKDTFPISILNWNDERQQNKVSTASENVQVFAEDFEIPQLNRKRKISVYLPPDYSTSRDDYPALYIQDGQNVFDVSTSNSGEWEVDETLNKLFDESGFGLIVVAIDHGGEKRLNEYSAWDNKKYGKGEGALYLDFLVNTLKPEIDRVFRTKQDSEHTAVIGSSLGGLFAYYAAVSRPDIFGKAGVFSPSFWYAKESFDIAEIATNLDNSKWYFLAGKKEGVDVIRPMQKMVAIIKSRGVAEDHIIEKVEPNGIHSESFWKSEFEEVITWLFEIKNQ